MFKLLALSTLEIALVSSEASSYKFNLRESNGLYYIQDFFLGTPSQGLRQILIDTGSSDLIVLQSGFNFKESSSFIIQLMNSLDCMDQLVYLEWFKLWMWLLLQMD